MVRDRKPKPEVINRLSPVDLPSYQKVELDQVSEYEHRKPLVKNQVFVLNKKQNKSNSKYYVEDIPKQTSDFNLLNELQLKGNNNNISSNNNYNSGIINNNEMNDVKMFINQINSNNSVSTNNFNNIANNLNSNNNNVFIPNTINNNNFNKASNNTNFNQGVNIPNMNNNMDVNNYNNFNNGIIDNNVNEGQNQKKEEKDKKWKYNKQELYERKKKMLKDKSNFK